MTWTERNTGLIFKWWLGGTLTESDVDGVFQFVGAKSQDEALRNWVDKDNPASEVGSPTWTREAGFNFDGTNDALDSQIMPGINATVLVLFNYLVTGSDRIFGQLSATTSQRIFITVKRNPTESVSISIGNGSTSYNTGSLLAGVDYVVGGMHDNPNKYIIWEGTKQAGVSFGSYLGSDSTAYIGAAQAIGGGIATDPWFGPIKACVIYNRVLTDAELLAVTANMKMLGATTNLSQYVYWIAQNPSTKHLNNTSQELLVATEGGCYRTQNGGRSWEMLPLPDPSNAEFADSPAATVDELSFRWIEYDPLDKLTLYVMATKASVSRMWIYKSVNNGDTWTSRGVDWV